MTVFGLVILSECSPTMRNEREGSFQHQWVIEVLGLLAAGYTIRKIIEKLRNTYNNINFLTISQPDNHRYSLLRI
jgi:hypothetical protein